MSDSYRPRTSELLARVLGPAGPELTCDECFEELDRYVEIELSGSNADATVPGMQAHLQGCPAGNEDHDSLLALLRSVAVPPTP
jgi:hypothetical protein